MDRVVAASSVSPVSTGPLYSLTCGLHCQLAPLLIGRPCKAPKDTSDMLKLERWLQTVRKNSSKSSSQQLSIFPSKQLVSGVDCKISEPSESRNQCCTTQWAEKVDIYTYNVIWTCCLASEKHRIDPKMVSEAISYPKIFWCSMHPESPSC